jgi:hypothetical protein
VQEKRLWNSAVFVWNGCVPVLTFIDAEIGNNVESSR